ncbi:substrate-binding periplasmic protein [Desulfovibrio psychrotolerans]|uniref:ABC transporter substrate-binding protein n=1 Tax=Desulfovibrio psychrotolerans TaxID=415242 RepID=A0A7J0BST2_9BACT|nr:transporter substrate-binding domain-containing protein [Desulfovibrio psychrotolerans]GFM36760.1 ABC transporter substrate-binding protein [Desulfovibrio psychrotolerans]
MRPSVRSAFIALLAAGLLSVLAYPLLSARPSLTLVCDIWPPYQYETEYGVDGFSVAVVSRVFEEMGIEMKPLQAFPWKRAMEILEHGHADGLFSANFTPDRALFAHFPQESLVDTPWVIWTRNSPIRSMEDLKGKRIGVVLGYSYTQEFWDFIETYCVVEQVHADFLNFRKLQLGRLDATVAELGNGLHILRMLKDETIRPHMDITVKTDGLFLIFSRRGVPEETVNDFSAHLRRFKETEAYRKLHEHYFPLPPSL